MSVEQVLIWLIPTASPPTRELPLSMTALLADPAAPELRALRIGADAWTVFDGEGLSASWPQVSIHVVGLAGSS